MIQRDLKIGLVLGLVIVAGVIFKLAIDPRLSTESRLNSNDFNDSLHGIDFQNTSQDNTSNEVEQSLYPDNQNEKVETVISQNTVTPTESARQNNDDAIPYSAWQNTNEEAHPEIRTQIELPVTPDKNPEVVETPSKPERFHIVQEDETLSSISRMYYGTPNKWQKIVDANPDVIKNPNKIKPGMKLVIP